jgi:subtilase family serine protease
MAMKTMLALSGQKQLRICGWIAACAMAVTTLGAQTPAPRIQSEINNELSQLKGSLHPLAQPQFDAGRVPANTKLTGISIVFNRSAAQQADLDALIAAQQNPASPLYHQWLTPDQFAARFGMAQDDIDKVQSWLQQQGFAIDSVARSKNLIRFSCTVGQVEQAFSTQMHYYKVNGEQHFAPSTALSVPAAIAPVVAAVRNLHDFRPRPMHIRSSSSRARPAYTFYYSSTQQAVLFAPGDIKVVYDFPTSSTGNIGTGQSIAIMGQSAVILSDIQNFQAAAGLSSKEPTLVLVPGSGSSTTFANGDEGESDLDIEWSSAAAPGAEIVFVYTGSNTTYGVFDSLQYAVDEKIAPIISLSYGSCEPLNTQQEINSEELFFSQAATQGQTVLAASGDQGSTACSGTTGLTTAQQEVIAVNYPASSAFVTGVGGTEIPLTPTSYLTAGDGYWLSATSTSQDTLTSAVQYIPETAWNDDAYSVQNGGGLSASGGGTSIYVSRPSWQKGTIGGASIPSGSYRLVPDIALYSSPNYPGYLFCTSDTSDWTPASPGYAAQQASCNNGFYDNATGDLTVAGGTSFAAPIFAGMVAIINQAKGYTDGQGPINPTLYSMAANAATYSSAFHDITSGNNDCLGGSTYCSTTTGFSAGQGYDEVTGLGSVKLSSLVTAWAPTVVVPTLVGTTTSLTATTSTPNVNASDTFTITVTAASGSATPTGTVTLQIDGGGSSSYGTGTTATASLTASTVAGTATATYQTSFATSGTHQIIAQYPIGATFAASVGTVQVTVAGGSSGKGTFALSATNATVSQGSTGSSTITVTPSGGYTGTVSFAITTSSSSLTNACYTITNATVSGTSAATTQLVFYTNSSDCTGAAVQKRFGSPQVLPKGTRIKLVSSNAPAHQSETIMPAAFSFVALLLAGLLGWRWRQLRVLAGILVLATLGLALSGCGGGSSGSGTTSVNAPKGNYSMTIVGTDTTTSTITAQTSMTLTID